MKNFELLALENFFLVQVRRTFIGVLGYALFCSDQSKERMQEEIYSILKLVDEQNLSFSLNLENKSVKLYFLIKGSNFTETIHSLVKVERRIKLFSASNSHILFSPLNHRNIANKIKKFLVSPLKQASHENVVVFESKKQVFFTLIPLPNETPPLSSILLELAEKTHCVIRLSSRIKTLNSIDHTYARGILISKQFSKEECEEDFFSTLDQILERYDPDCYISLRFFTLKEIEQNKLFFSLGVSTVESSFKNETLVELSTNQLSQFVKKRVAFSAKPND